MSVHDRPRGHHESKLHHLKMIMCALCAGAIPFSVDDTVFAQTIDEYDIPGRIFSIATGHIDGDGAIDLLASTDPPSCDRIAILFNNGDGTFDDPVFVAIACSTAELRVADLNGDSFDDLVSRRQNADGVYCQVHLNDGHGGFLLPTSYLAWTVDDPIQDFILADVNSDTYPDLVIGIRVYDEYSGEFWTEFVCRFNDGAGGFEDAGARRIGYASTFLNTMLSGDFDNDGDVDFAAGTTYSDFDGYDPNEQYVQVYLNEDGQGHTWDKTTYELTEHGQPEISGLAAIDADRDGDYDLAVSADRGERSDSFVLLLRNDGNGGFEWSSPIARKSLGYETGITSRDLDGNGVPDLAVSYYRGAMFLMNPERDMTGWNRFDVEASIGEAWGVNPILPADVDGDGMWDLIGKTSDRPISTITVIRNEWEQDRPQYSQTPLVAGERATMRVTGAEAGRRAFFLYGFGEAGSTPGVLVFGGTNLDLPMPIQLIRAQVVDENGVSEISVKVPESAANQMVTTQAIIRAGEGGQDSLKTRFYENRVQP